MCFKFFEKLRTKRMLKKIVVEPKGICIALYCYRIIFNLLSDEDIIYPYEKNLRDLYYQTYPNSPYYDYDERQEIAYDYLSMSLNCSNGDEVFQRIMEELEDVHRV